MQNVYLDLFSDTICLGFLSAHWKKFQCYCNLYSNWKTQNNLFSDQCLTSFKDAQKDEEKCLSHEVMKKMQAVRITIHFPLLKTYICKK